MNQRQSPITLDVMPRSMLDVCCSCQRHPPLWQQRLCRTCYESRLFQHRLRLGATIWFRWLIACMIDALLGLIVGLVTILPVQAAPNGIVLLQHSDVVAGMVVISTVVALLIGGVQAYLLREWITRPFRWAMISAAGIVSSWWMVVISWIIAGQIIGGVPILLEVAIGIVVMVGQSGLLRFPDGARRWWLLGSIAAWALAGSLGVWVEWASTSPLSGTIGSFVVSRFAYGALAGLLFAAFAWYRADSLTPGQMCGSWLQLPAAERVQDSNSLVIQGDFCDGSL